MEASGSIAWRVRVENPCVKKCVTAVGPKTSHPDISTGVRLCVGSQMAEGLSSQDSGVEVVTSFSACAACVPFSCRIRATIDYSDTHCLIGMPGLKKIATRKLITAIVD